MGLQGVVMQTIGFEPQTGAYYLVHPVFPPPHQILMRSRDIGPIEPTAETPWEACQRATAFAVIGPKYPVAFAERYPSAFKNSCKPRTSSPRVPCERLRLSMAQMRCLFVVGAMAGSTGVVCTVVAALICTCNSAILARRVFICDCISSTVSAEADGGTAFAPTMSIAATVKPRNIFFFIQKIY